MGIYLTPTPSVCYNPSMTAKTTWTRTRTNERTVEYVKGDVMIRGIVVVRRGYSDTLKRSTRSESRRFEIWIDGHFCGSERKLAQAKRSVERRHDSMLSLALQRESRVPAFRESCPKCGTAEPQVLSYASAGDFEHASLKCRVCNRRFQVRRGELPKGN